jgi:predicted RNA-binding protein with PIN domain
MPTRSIAAGMLEAAAVILAFPLLGFGARAALQVGSAPPTYSESWMDEIRAEDSELWLVDGFNVVQVALLSGRAREGWWRAERREELMARAAQLASAGVRVEVVFDGAQPEPEGDGAGPRPVFAESADAWLVARVRAASDPARIAVVTADRSLAGRVRHHGARVVTPGEFLRLCSSRAG